MIPTTADYSFLTHPITLIMLTALIGGLGYIIGVFVGLVRDNSTLTQTAKDIKELLVTVTAEVKEHREAIDYLKTNLTCLQAEHDILSEGHKKKVTHSHQSSMK